MASCVLWKKKYPSLCRLLTFRITFAHENRHRHGRHLERNKYLFPFPTFLLAVSTFTKGEQMIPVLNMLDTRCAVFGNHDFGEKEMHKLKWENAFMLLFSPHKISVSTPLWSEWRKPNSPGSCQTSLTTKLGDHSRMEKSRTRSIGAAAKLDW